jgi:hemin uptake protein HemP
MNPDSVPKPGASMVSPKALSGLPESSPAPRIVDSAELFQGQSLLPIRHLGEIYRLQITRQGKLILTK